MRCFCRVDNRAGDEYAEAQEVEEVKLRELTASKRMLNREQSHLKVKEREADDERVEVGCQNGQVVQCGACVVHDNTEERVHGEHAAGEQQVVQHCKAILYISKASISHLQIVIDDHGTVRNSSRSKVAL